MKIIKFKKSFDLFSNFLGITIYPFIIIFDHEYLKDKVALNHEEIHGKQYGETLVIGFYILYALSWVWNIFKYKFNLDKAYMNIIFEKEAYEHEKDLNYLKTRKHYNWLKYLKPLKK